MEFVAGTRIHQCEQSDHPPAGQVSACCDSAFRLKRPGSCDHPGVPNFGRWGISAQKRNRDPLTWEDIKEEIRSARPIAFSLMDMAEKYSHMMVIVGYVETPGENFIQYLSPEFEHEPEVQLATYRWYLGNAEPEGLAKHQYDYYLIE